MVMRRNIFDYLEKFDNDDLRDIKRYLDSSFFNITSRSRVIALFQLLKRHHPKYENTTDEFLSKKLKIGISSVRNLKTILINCIEHYLQLKMLAEQKQLKAQLLAQAFDDLNMHQDFIKHAELQLAKLSKKPCLSKEDYQLKYELLWRQHAIVAHNMLSTKNTALEDAINTFTYYYLYESLKNLNGLISTNYIVDRGAEILLTNQIINSINNIELIDNVNIQSAFLIFKYYHIKNGFLEERKNTYNTLKKLVENSWAKLTDEYKFETYQHMINMAKTVEEIDAKKFKHEDFVIHQFWIDKGVHQIYPEMHYLLFISIVTSSCDAQQMDWCEKFIFINKKMIPVKERTPTVDFSLAYLYFSSNKLDDAIEKLYAIQPLDVHFNLIVRMLRLRCLFVANYIERFNDYYNSTYNFINNHTEINEAHKSYYLKFIAFLKQVRNARERKNIKKLTNIKKDIETNIDVQNYRWLLKIIEKLIKEL